MPLIFYVFFKCSTTTKGGFHWQIKHIDELFDDLAGDNVPIFDDELKTEDIFIDDDYLFDSSDEQETKNIFDYVLNDIDQNDFLFEDLPKPEFVARD